MKKQAWGENIEKLLCAYFVPKTNWINVNAPCNQLLVEKNLPGNFIRTCLVTKLDYFFSFFFFTKKKDTDQNLEQKFTK